MEKQKRPINGLTIVRVVATLMIVTVHFGQPLPLPFILRTPVLYCQTAVCAFFILTGYMTEMSLKRDENVKKYYIKRIARIIPVYYCVVLINMIAGFLIGTYPSDSTHLGWVRFFTFTNAVIPSNDYAYWNNGAALWTMSGFCIFYILAPVFHKLMKNKRYAVILLMCGVSLSLVSEQIMLYLSKTENLYSESWEYLATHHVFFVLYEMILGMYICNRDKNKHGSLIPIFIICFIGKIYNMNWMLNTAIYGAVILWLSQIESIKAPRVINKIISVIDEYSYSIYLGHTTVMFIFSRLQEVYAFSDVVLGAIDLAGCMVFIPVLHLVVEKRGIRLIEKIKIS